MKFGDKIKQLRQQAGLTQPEMADKAGIEQSYLSKLENEKSSPSFDIIKKIAAVFNLDPLALIALLDKQYVRDNLSHLPEVAAKIELAKEKSYQAMRKAYIKAATAIVFGIALVLLSNSSGIFSHSVYQYKSMGYIQPEELNSQYSPGMIHTIYETRDQQLARLQNNKKRIDEMLVMSDSYRGEGFVQYYENKRRFFELIAERDQISPWPSIFLILGMASLVSGGLYMGYIFRFISRL